MWTQRGTKFIMNLGNTEVWCIFFNLKDQIMVLTGQWISRHNQRIIENKTYGKTCLKE